MKKSPSTPDLPPDLAREVAAVMEILTKGRAAPKTQDEWRALTQRALALVRKTHEDKP